MGKGSGIVEWAKLYYNFFLFEISDSPNLLSFKELIFVEREFLSKEFCDKQSMFLSAIELIDLVLKTFKEVESL